MSDALLTTKLAPPPLRAHWVPRPRLTAKLDEGTARALTLISATAGFGKTTLVSEWLKTREHATEPKNGGETLHETKSLVSSLQSPVSVSSPSIAWLALDADDNTPKRLLRHVIGALQTIAPSWGNNVLARLDDNPLESFADIPDALLNELHALDQACVIILDDYHVITSPEVHLAVGYALEHLPSQVHLILITRADPPLPLARLRARDQLTEIRAADLAFTPEEAIRFLNQVMGLDLTLQQIDALEKRTEGWIAGLQLAALSLRGQSDVNAFIENFTGNDRYIFDYLAEEVLRKLDTPTRAFLLSTSVLDRVCAFLGEAVTGTPDAQAVLERLEHDNLFTIAMDTHREWYRYHHLFGELLRHELRTTRGSEIPELHKRAAEWFESQGLYAEAIQHWLEVQEFSRAAPLMEQTVIGYLERAEFKTMLSWLDALPQEYRTRFPRLALAQVWAFMVLGQFEDAEAQIALAAQQLTDPADMVQLETLRALFVSLRGGEQNRVAEAVRAYANAATGTAFTRGLAALNLGTSYLFEGDLDAGYEVLGEAENLVRGAGNHLLATVAASARADLEMLRGNLKHAHASLGNMLATLATASQNNPMTAQAALVGMADVEREWNRLEEAREKLNAAQATMHDRFGAPRFYFTSAAVERALGNYDVAQELLDRMRTDARRFLLPIFQSQMTAQQASLYLARGDIAAAEKWFETRRVNLEIPPTFTHGAALLAFAELLLAQERLDDAFTLLARLEETGTKSGCVPRLILIQLLRAIGYSKRGLDKSARDTLRGALEQAEPEGYIRLLIERGTVLADLLQTLPALPARLETYRRTLLTAFPSNGHPELPAASKITLTLPEETLSERELEILALVASGLSNNEIAQQLVLTAGTVKWHVNNIFSKLDVHNRTQAVARARALNLLS